MSIERLTEQGLSDSREFAAYLRRLADAVEAGKAAGRSVTVEYGREYRRENLHPDPRADRLIRTIEGPDEHEIRIVSLTRIHVKRCERCGDFHEVGTECRDQRRLVGPGYLGNNWP